MKPDKKKSLLLQLFILILTVSMIATNAFGSSPDNPISSQFQSVLLGAVPPDLAKSANEFLASIGASPLPKANEINVDITPLDPGGYILSLFGAKDLPPLNEPVKLDPAGAILALFNVDASQIPDPSITRDPVGDIAKLFGFSMQDLPKENGPLILDPAGLLLRTFIREEYLTAPQPNPLLDPGGAILGIFFPAESLQYSENSPLLDPGGAILSFLFPNVEIPAEVANASAPGVDLIALFEPLFATEPPANNIPAPDTVSLLLPANTPLPTQPKPTASLALPPSTLTPIATVQAAFIFPPTATLIYRPLVAAPNQPQDSPVSIPTDTPIPPTPTNTPDPNIVIVNSLNDPGTGICDATECTLREAVNIVPGSGTVTFDSTLAGGTIRLQSAINLANSMTIDGSNLTMQITISGDSDNNGTGDVQLFNINSGGITFKNLTMTYGTFSGGKGGAIALLGGDATVTGCFFSNGSASYGAAIHTQSTGSLNIYSSTFSGNQVSASGGAISNQGTGNITVNSSKFFNNIASARGGAIFNQTGSTTITNTVFATNSSSGNGGAITNASTGNLTVTNSTFYGNSTSNSGGAIDNFGGTVTLTNSILWGDSATVSNPEYIDTGIMTINNSDIQGNGLIGTNIDSDPLYTNPGGNNFILGAGSPAIDTANAACPATDIRGTTRPVGAACDMGAYEGP